MTVRDPRDEASVFSDDLFDDTMDTAAVLESIARRVAEIVGEASVLTVVSEDGTILEPVACYHPDAVVRAFIEEVLASHPYRIGEGVAGRVAAERRLAVVNGMHRPSLKAGLQSHGHLFEQRYPIRALVIVPMITGGNVVGTLGAVRIDSEEDYENDDVLVMSALAERAAAALVASRRAEGSPPKVA